MATINIIGTSTTNLIACNHIFTIEELTKLKEEKHIKTKNGILEWISPQEKPFNEVDNKYYFVVWKGNENDNWRIINFKNDINLNTHSGKRKLDTSILQIVMI